MAKKELMLNESVALNFQYGQQVFKLSINLEGGMLLLEELHQNQKEPDIKQVIILKDLK